MSSQKLTYYDLKECLRRGDTPSNLVPVYRARNNIYAIDTSDRQRVNVKDFHVPKGLNSLIYGWIRKSKARRSLENARRLQALGFGTPQPLDFIETYLQGHRLNRSYYLSLQVEGYKEIRCWETWPEEERDALLSDLAPEILRLFAAGVYFRDFSPGNILWKQKPTIGEPKFCYVDLNRMSFRKPLPSPQNLSEKEIKLNFSTVGMKERRRLMRMLRVVNIVPSEAERLGRAVAQEAGWNSHQTAMLLLRSLSAYHRTKTLHRALKRLLP